MKYKIEGRVKHITEMQLAKSRRLETIGQMTKFIFLGELRGKGNYKHTQEGISWWSNG